MRQLNKKAWSLILTLCIAISMVIVPAATVNAAADETGSTAAAGLWPCGKSAGRGDSACVQLVV